MKRYNFSKNKTAHIIAITAATLLHLSLFLWLTKPSKPIVLEQAITVTMVAPSSEKERKKPITIKLQTNFISSKNQIKTNEVAKITKEKPKKVEEEKRKEKEIVKKDLRNFNTSGEVDKNAVEKNSAKSDPIFNASYLQNPAPRYPYEAKRKGNQGKVMLKVKVNKFGNASLVEIEKSSGFSSLDDSAKRAVENWRFVPAYIGTEAVEATVLVPIEFKLD